jgi:Lar family restriction alleviation protein
MNLKPCPFCGKKVSLQSTEIFEDGDEAYHITCGDWACIAHNPYYPVSRNKAANDKSKQILIEKWNTRA